MRDPKDWIYVDSRPGMIAVACIVGAVMLILAALVVGGCS